MTTENHVSSPTPEPLDSVGSVESFDDGTLVRFILSEGLTVAGEATEARRRVTDRPDGMGTAVPVARGGQLVADLAVETLRQSLRPVKPLLEEVHQAVAGVAVPPSEISVSFGIQVGSDLKLGIVGSKGQAHLTVTASWQPTDSGPAAGRDESRGSDPGEDEERPETQAATGTGTR